MTERIDAIDHHDLADTNLMASDPVSDLSGLSSGPTLCRARPAGEGTRTIRLPHAVASVPDSREVLVADLTARRLSTTVIEEAEMVVSELVSNAVRHAKGLADGCVRIRWKVKGGAVEIEVSDGGGPTVPKPSPPSPWAVGGRGLRIVRSLAHEWGVQEDRHGRTVWAAVGGPSRRRRL